MKLALLLIMFLLTTMLIAQVDIKKEKKDAYLDDYGKVKMSLLRQGSSSGLNCDLFDNHDSWEFARTNTTAPFNGPVLFNDGSASTPSVTFIDDFNTGFFRVGADILGFTTGGSTRMVVDSGGSVGIASYTSLSNLFVVGNSSVGLNVQSGGNVGIGTASPGSSLEILQNPFITASTNTSIAFINMPAGKYTNNTVNHQRLVGLRIRQNLDATAGTKTTDNVGIHIETYGGDNNYPLITQGGNVGIGISTPSASLDVNGNVRIETGSGYLDKGVCYLGDGTLGHCTGSMGGTGSCTCVAN